MSDPYDYDNEHPDYPNYRHYKLAANVLALTIAELGYPLAFTEAALLSLRGKALKIEWNEANDCFVASVIDKPDPFAYTLFPGGDA